jgi:hypothetical protein
VVGQWRLYCSHPPFSHVMHHSRRSFLKTSAVVTAGLAAAQGFAHASGSDTDTAKIVEPINTEISAPGDIPLLEGPARGECARAI